MSWSKSAKGTALEVVAAAAAWEEEVVQQDNDADASDVIKDGHVAQVAIAREAIRMLADLLPDQTLQIGAHGHASADGSGSVGVSYSLTE